MQPRIIIVLAVTVCTILATGAPLWAQMGGKGKRAAMQDGGPTQEEGRHQFLPSGLTPLFAPEANCPGVASPFGSETRYDGSFRPMTRYGGRHGGMDLTLKEGTPLRAIGRGRIIHLGAGGQAEGYFLWLQMAPEDTGLPFWVYAKYQHFQEMPKRTMGETVEPGAILGPSGKSGTVGGHYGPNGYPHLHLTALASPSGEYQLDGSRVVTDSPRIIDPLALFVPDLENLDDLSRLPEPRKKVAIPYLTETGIVVPTGSKLVWPVACPAR